MFDIGLGEVLVTFGVGIAVIGRKDLPIFARAVGRQLGRAVSYVKRSKDSLGNKLDQTVGHAELQQVQAELNKTMRELDVVKREIYSASNISTSTFIKQPQNNFNSNDSQNIQQQSYFNSSKSTNVNTDNSTGLTNVTSFNYNKNQDILNSNERTGSNLLTEIYLEEWEH